VGEYRISRKYNMGSWERIFLLELLINGRARNVGSCSNRKNSSALQKSENETSSFVPENFCAKQCLYFLPHEWTTIHLVPRRLQTVCVASLCASAVFTYIVILYHPSLPSLCITMYNLRTNCKARFCHGLYAIFSFHQ
jgi:hypothetical protein